MLNAKEDIGKPSIKIRGMAIFCENSFINREIVYNISRRVGQGKIGLFLTGNRIFFC